MSPPLPNPARDTYVSLASFRRDGREVRTPVWIAGDAPEFYVFSAGDAGKVKRIRRNPRVRIATCNARGGDLGDWQEATARIIESPAEIGLAYKALRLKYGTLMWLGDVLSKLVGRFHKRALIAIRLENPPP